VADDDDRFREELTSALVDYEWIDVVASARNAYEAAQLFEELSPTWRSWTCASGGRVPLA
jgi:DNA-binding NarL/FixJ family response regulator